MEEAREAIQQIEPFDREFFTGMLGWSDLNGDGEWIVTIRCAEVQENTLRLYAGAGVVAESKPEDELAETSAKFQTMLKALGLNDSSLNESRGRKNVNRLYKMAKKNLPIAIERKGVGLGKHLAEC